MLDVVDVFVQRGKADVARARTAEIRAHLTDPYGRELLRRLLDLAAPSVA